MANQLVMELGVLPKTGCIHVPIIPDSYFLLYKSLLIFSNSFCNLETVFAGNVYFLPVVDVSGAAIVVRICCSGTQEQSYVDGQ